MENIVLNGENIDLNSLHMEKLKKILVQLDTEKLELEQDIDNILEKLV